MLSPNKTYLPEELDMNRHCLSMSEEWDLNDLQYRFIPTNVMSTEYIIEKLQQFELKKCVISR